MLIHTVGDAGMIGGVEPVVVGEDRRGHHITRVAGPLQHLRRPGGAHAAQQTSPLYGPIASHDGTGRDRIVVKRTKPSRHDRNLVRRNQQDIIDTPRAQHTPPQRIGKNMHGCLVPLHDHR